ncbi:hypothetical protein PENTCL1PPCAC_21491, partial [Pristionchus entomophagus]
NGCLDGFSLLIDGWCYAKLERGIYTSQSAEDDCFSDSQAHLPTLSTPDLNEALVQVRNVQFGPNSYIWIGLNCSSHGNWYWLDGTPYDESQENFVPG